MPKCPNCGKCMTNVMHFEKAGSYAYHSCKACVIQTHKKRIHYEDIEETTQKQEGDNNGKHKS